MQLDLGQKDSIAHWPFFGEADGISRDYINKQGHSEFSKPGVEGKDNLIKYAELDSYDADMSELYDKLGVLLDSAAPITSVDEELRAAIEEAIGSSSNVVRFRKRASEDDTQPK
jgi:hypothetical protein